MKKFKMALRFCFFVCALFLAISAFAQSTIHPPTEFVDELTGQTIVDSNAKKLIILIHGWNPQGATNKYYATDEWYYLDNILHLKLAASDWKLVFYHWETDANTGYIGWDQMPFVQNAANAADFALVHGDYLGSHLNEIAPNLRQVHLIAHSAGSWAAYRAAQQLLQLNPYITVQVTLLDPFIPRTTPFPFIPVSSLTLDMMNNLAFVSQNDRLHRLENYFAEDTIPSGTLGTDNTFTGWRNKDINQRVDHGFIEPGLNFWYDSHAGPIEFYADTVSASISGYPMPSGLTPSLVTNGWNHSLFTESFFIPRINTHPQNTTKTSGSSVSLSTTAVSSQAMSYQWFKDGQQISGATSSSYNFTASPSTVGDYVARVSNIFGQIFSDKATISLTTPAAPSITSVSPSTLPTSFSTQLINIYGSNFKAAGNANVSTLIFRDPANAIYVRTPVFVSSSQLQYSITVQNAVGTWSVTVTNAGQAASNLQTFQVAAAPPNTGSLTVNLSPAGATSAGAQWRVDGGSYRNTGDTATSLTPGTHTVSFKSISGYTTPADKSETITSGQTTTDSGTYTVIAASTYTLTINSAGVQGYAVGQPFGSGSGNIYNPGAVVELTANAYFGYHFVSWSGDASGTGNPTTITMNGNKNVSANFASGDPNLGTIIVTIQPPEAAAAGVTWGFNDNDFRPSGASYSHYPNTVWVQLHNTNGWIGYGGWVTLTAGVTTNYIFAASSTTGSIVGNDPRNYYTLAGSAGNSGSADGTNSSARFAHPVSLVIDSANNIFVADNWNSIIKKITPQGIVTTVAGQVGVTGYADGQGTNAIFNNMQGIAVDSSGNLFVADMMNSVIRKITPNGNVSTFAGQAGNNDSIDATGSAARFYFPVGVTVGADGNLYVSDSVNQTIRKITSSGAVTTLAGFPRSYGYADGTGNAARFNGPSGLAADVNNNVYVADKGNQVVRKVTPAGVVTTLAGFPGSSGAADGAGNAARFNNLNSVAMDSAGNVYVADISNHAIRKMTPAGVVTTLAGQSGNPGSADGVGSLARFYQPSGVAVNSAGNLFVTDMMNYTIRATQSFATKFDQTITFGTPLDKHINDLPFALFATASSALQVSFSIVSGPATLSNNVVTLLGVGTVTVRASQAGDSTFNAATNIDRSFVVTKLPQTITFGSLSRQVFGDAPFALSAAASSGLPVSFSVLSGPAVVSGNILTVTGAGLVVLRASQAGNATNAPAPNVDQVLIVVPGNNVITDFQRLANGMFTFRFYGEPSTNYVVQASTNLVQWVALATNQISGLGYLEFTDTAATNFSKRFYRIAPPGAAASGLPLLSLMLSGNKVVVLWPTNDAAFKLEYATNLPAATWLSNSITPAIVSGRYAVTNSATNKFRFYRLKK